MDHTLLREKMVRDQIIQRGVREPRVLGAFYRVERHKFVSGPEQEYAYADSPLSIGAGQTISQPYMVALMTELLRLRGSEKVLEIGTGSGYQTAILAELNASVYTVERLHPLSHRAATILKSLGYGTVQFKVDDGSLGWKEEAPFDRIIVTAACPRPPFPLEEQLGEGGLILLPVGETNFHQKLMLGEKTNGMVNYSAVCDCVFVPMIGELGMFPK